MNPCEIDGYEELQRTKFRPNSFNQAKDTAKSLSSLLKKQQKLLLENPQAKIKKLPVEESKMLIRLENLIRGNAVFDGFTCDQYLDDILSKDSLGNRIALARLMKDTNKGISDIDDQIDFPFDDGTKPTEKYAKLRLIQEFSVPADDFVLLPDAGPDRLVLDEKGKQLILVRNLDSKAKVRSIDAISVLQNVVILWCMKYKGGTAAVGGSGQMDQGTTEGAHMSKLIEQMYQDGHPLEYLGKPVFFANMVYGAQFNDEKRIFQNEMSFRADNDCVRSFNISIDRVADTMKFLDDSKLNLDTALEKLYNKYGYDIEYTGRLKPQERKRLEKWIMN